MLWWLLDPIRQQIRRHPGRCWMLPMIILCLIAAVAELLRIATRFACCWLHLSVTNLCAVCLGMALLTTYQQQAVSLNHPTLFCCSLYVVWAALFLTALLPCRALHLLCGFGNLVFTLRVVSMCLLSGRDSLELRHAIWRVYSIEAPALLLPQALGVILWHHFF